MNVEPTMAAAGPNMTRVSRRHVITLVALLVGALPVYLCDWKTSHEGGGFGVMLLGVIGMWVATSR